MAFSPFFKYMVAQGELLTTQDCADPITAVGGLEGRQRGEAMAGGLAGQGCRMQALLKV